MHYLLRQGMILQVMKKNHLINMVGLMLQGLQTLVLQKMLRDILSVPERLVFFMMDSMIVIIGVVRVLSLIM